MKQNIFKHIVAQPDVRFGKPVIEGTRVPVDLIVGKIAGGMTIEAVAAEYELTREEVLATLQYAAKVLAEEEIAIA